MQTSQEVGQAVAGSSCNFKESHSTAAVPLTAEAAVGRSLSAVSVQLGEQMHPVAASGGKVVGPIEAGLWGCEVITYPEMVAKERSSSWRQGPTAPTAAAAGYSSVRGADSPSAGVLSGTVQYSEEFDDVGSASSSQPPGRSSVIQEEVGLWEAEGVRACKIARRGSASGGLVRNSRGSVIEEELASNPMGHIGYKGKGGTGVGNEDSIREELGGQYSFQLARAGKGWGITDSGASEGAMEVEDDAGSSAVEAVEEEESIAACLPEEPAASGSAGGSYSKDMDNAARWYAPGSASSQSQARRHAGGAIGDGDIEEEEGVGLGSSYVAVDSSRRTLGNSSKAAGTQATGVDKGLDFGGSGGQGPMRWHVGEVQAAAAAAGCVVKGVDDAERLLFSNLSSSLQRLVSGGEDALGLRSMLEQEVRLYAVPLLYLVFMNPRPGWV